MKIKQFFIENKHKIKKFFQWFLVGILFFVGSYLIYACGYYTRDKLDSSEVENKKELVHRKESNKVNNDFEFQIYSTEPWVSLVDSVYQSNQGNLSISFYSDIFLIDNGISFDNEYYSLFPNRGTYEFSSSNHKIYFSDMDLDIDLYNYDFDMSVGISVSGSSPILSPEGSEGYIWQFDLEFEVELTIGVYHSYAYFTDTIQYDIHYLLSDDIWFDTYDEWSSYFISLRDNDSFEVLKDGLFYTGTNPYYFYNSVYDIGYQEGQPKNIFYYNVEKDSPYLLVLDETTYIRPDDYDENLLFKNNYLDLQYLRSLYSGQYSKFRIIFMYSIYSLKDLYLSLDNSSLIDYNILVNGKAYTINSSGTLNIPSSELLQVIEFDSSLLESTRLINSSPDYANGFNNGYENGFSYGYLEGETDQDDYYNEMIIPAIKTEYEQLGYDKGYLQGKNDTLNDGSGVAMFDVFTLIGKGFDAWNPILNMQIIPGFTLGVFIAIPIIIGVVFIVIKLLQR